jgi:hypothetical protein
MESIVFSEISCEVENLYSKIADIAWLLIEDIILIGRY